MSNNDYWAETAPQYKKDGEMYSRVEYDDEGDPREVRVARDQRRLGDFEIEDGTAVYVPHRVTNPGGAVIDYVASLPFVEEVEMEPATQ